MTMQEKVLMGTAVTLLNSLTVLTTRLAADRYLDDDAIAQMVRAQQHGLAAIRMLTTRLGEAPETRDFAQAFRVRQ